MIKLQVAESFEAIAKDETNQGTLPKLKRFQE
jgi:hypothetical protein